MHVRLHCHVDIQMAVGVAFTALPFVLLLAQITECTSAACKKSPIILIPGLMGSQLEAQLHKKTSDHWYCFKTYREWYRLWLDIDDIFVFSQECFRENIRLYFNKTTGNYSNRPGVKIRVKPPQYGDTRSFETLDPNFSAAAYFDKFVEHFEGIGYKRNESIVGAAYDWRLGPKELTETGFFSTLKSMIEDTAAKHNGCPVSIVTHSMGGLVSHHFLVRLVSQQWKDKYIHQLITLSAVWGGAARVLKGIVSGDQDGIFELSKTMMLREDERSFPSGYWLIPVGIDPVWSNSQAIVTTPTKQYTAHDIPELISDLNYEGGMERYRGVINSSVQGLPPPNVPVHCFYGSEVDTEESYSYSGDFPNVQPSIRKGKGDGTVNLQSLEACRLWAGQQPYKVQWYPMNQTDHVGIVRAKNVFEVIEQLVTN